MPGKRFENVGTPKSQRAPSPGEFSSCGENGAKMVRAYFLRLCSSRKFVMLLDIV